MTWGIQPHFWLTPPELENCGHVGKYANLTVFGCLAVLSVAFWELPTINCMANAPQNRTTQTGTAKNGVGYLPNHIHPYLSVPGFHPTPKHSPTIPTSIQYSQVATSSVHSYITSLLLPSTVYPYSLHIISSSSTTSSCIPYLRTPLPFPAFALIFNNLD